MIAAVTVRNRIPSHFRRRSSHRLERDASPGAARVDLDVSHADYAPHLVTIDPRDKVRCGPWRQIAWRGLLAAPSDGVRYSLPRGAADERTDALSTVWTAG